MVSVVNRDIGHDGINSLRGKWIISFNYNPLLETGLLVCPRWDEV